MAVSRGKSIATRRFWELFQALPSEVQNLAVKNHHLLPEPSSSLARFPAFVGKRRSLQHSRRRSLSRPRQARRREDDLGLDRHPLRLRPAGRLLSGKGGPRDRKRTRLNSSHL